MTPTPKRYDERYFRRWYHARGGVTAPADLERRVRLAVAAAEFVLERPVRSALDVGCGEARWRAPLKRLRPALTYQGVDPSEWVVHRWGSRRNIRRGSLGELEGMRLRSAYDLVICSDVLHYLEDGELKRGVEALRGRAAGILWLDAFTSTDRFAGDREGWKKRTARAYRAAFKRAGLIQLAPCCWIPQDGTRGLAALERPS